MQTYPSSNGLVLVQSPHTVYLSLYAALGSSNDKTSHYFIYTGQGASHTHMVGPMQGFFLLIVLKVSHIATAAESYWWHSRKLQHILLLFESPLGVWDNPGTSKPSLGLQWDLAGRGIQIVKVRTNSSIAGWLVVKVAHCMQICSLSVHAEAWHIREI
jgi:hypothetical protein